MFLQKAYIVTYQFYTSFDNTNNLFVMFNQVFFTKLYSVCVIYMFDCPFSPKKLLNSKNMLNSKNVRSIWSPGLHKI